MALHRTTQLLLNRILTGRVPAAAFFTLSPFKGEGTPGDEGISGHVGGMQFRDLIDPVNMTFDLPLTLRTAQESIDGVVAQPTVRGVIQLGELGITLGLPLRGGPLFVNRNFEFDLPLGDNYATMVRNALVGAGLIASAGSLVNAGIPAALNSRLAGQPAHEAAVY